MDKLEAVDEREQSRQTIAARRKAEREQRQEEQVPGRRRSRKYSTASRSSVG
jgi:hypothetical protein